MISGDATDQISWDFRREIRRRLGPYGLRQGIPLPLGRATRVADGGRGTRRQSHCDQRVLVWEISRIHRYHLRRCRLYGTWASPRTRVWMWWRGGEKGCFEMMCGGYRYSCEGHIRWRSRDRATGPNVRIGLDLGPSRKPLDCPRRGGRLGSRGA